MPSAARRLGLILLGALVFRVVLAFAVDNFSFDSAQYVTLARNLLRDGVFSVSEAPPLAPTMVRPPGYPLFLAVIFAVAGESMLAVRLAQAVIDTATVGLVFVLASRLALRRPHVAAIVAALCPFTAIYTTWVLAETLATFLVTLALVLLIDTARKPHLARAAACGLTFGALVMVRPDFGLLPPVAFLFWLLARRSRASFLKLAAVASVACVAVFGPWIARNQLVLGELTMANSVIFARPGGDRLRPSGFWRWFGTWADRMDDLHVTAWPYLGGQWDAVQIPERAVADADERRRVEAIRERLQASADPAAVMSVDDDFARLARERASRQPVRTWLLVPARRAVILWVNGRTAGFPLPASADILAGRASPAAALLKAGIVAANFGLLALSALGVWVLRKRSLALAVLLGLIAYRTVFHAFYCGMEPRYVISAFPALFALTSAALVWLWRALSRVFFSARS